MSADLLGVDLLSNPAVMGNAPKLDIKMPDLENIEIPTLDDLPPPPSAPKLVPSFEETGPIQMSGLDNFNAEAFLGGSRRNVSEETVLKEKYELLRKFERLGKLGVPMRKRFTIDSPLEEMRMELEFIKNEKAMDSTIKQFSEWFVTGMSALEWGSQNVAALKMFGLQLDGLSESAQMNVVDMEEDFEELYDMYGSKMKMHPLVRIPMRVCMMVYMVHLTNQMARKAPIPNIEEIMRQNPDIARSLGAAAMQNQMRGSAQPAVQSNPLAGFMQGMIPPGPPPAAVVRQAPPPAPRPNLAKIVSMPSAPPPPPKREMKPPPAGIAELLKSINAPPPDAPKLPPPVDPRTETPPPSAMKKSGNDKKSTGKNSVVIKL